MPKKKTSKSGKTFKFEEALAKLEGIVNDLENGECSLDDALKKYEEGVACARGCTEKLNETKKKIELLVETSQDSFSTEPFGPSQDDEEELI